jgi:polysaccharide biosynthesis transport protein
MARANRSIPQAPTGSDDIDVAGLVGGVVRNKWWIILPTLLALAGSIAFVMTATPLFKATSDILIENRETLYTAPGGESAQTPVAEREIGEDVVQSQAQLVLARDASLEVIRSLGLGALPEFDPAIEGPSALGRVLVLLRLAPSPTNASPEDRVLRTFLDKVDAYPNRGSRIVTIEASSQDPELATKIANGLASEYIKRETRAKQDTAVQASSFLLGEINTLRGRVTEAEAKVETFRSEQGLLKGQNATTITTQQLSELSTQLASARSRQADLMARARLIRESLRNGRIFEVSEVINNELVRRLLEQRSVLRGQLALEERIYLPQHPRIKELSAQINDLEGQIRSAADRTARSLENDARTSLARVEQLNEDINSQKTVASKANDSEVQLRQLEREAKALRDQLETYLARYNDAQARDRENSVAADARIVSQAIVPSTPTFPKKLPIISIATLGTFFLSAVLALTAQLLGAATLRSRARDERDEPHFMPHHATSQEPIAHPAPANGAGFARPAYSAGTSARGANAYAAAPMPLASANGGLSLDARMVLDPDSAAATGIRSIAANLAGKRMPGRAACLVVVADQAGADATSAAIALGRTLAREGRTILVDLNARHPGLGRLIGTGRPVGLSNVLVNQSAFADAIHRDRGSRAHVLPVGDAGLDPMQSPMLAPMLDALSQTYEFMVIDAGICGRQRAELIGGSDRALIVTAGNEASAAVRTARSVLDRLGAADIAVFASTPSGAPRSPAFAAAG